MSVTSGSEVENREHSLAADVFAYIALAFGFSWVLTIGSIKLGLTEEYLNIGTAGPAVAALILSRRRQSEQVQPSARRWALFVALLVLCWIVLCLHYSWWGDSASPAHFKPWLLIPALLPTWILSSAFSANKGVRNLMMRLLHPPGRWSMYALLFFPVLLGIPSAIAYLFGAKLAWPDLGGFRLAAISKAAMFFFYNLLFVGTLEEPGWRGFLLDRLQNKFSPLSASLLTWLPWALWHAPVDYYRPVRFTWVQEILLRVVFLIPLTLIMTWFYNRSGRSIQATVIFHASMNTFPYVFAFYQLSWLVVFVFAAYAVIADRMWRRDGVHRLSEMPDAPR